MSLPSARPGQLQYGFYGNHTASIDWCEENFQVTPYIAEFINTTSNIPTAIIAAYGIYKARQERLPSRVAINFSGILIIALGSIYFHATMSHLGQLMDELPMIWNTSFMVWSACETSLGYKNYRLLSPLSFSLLAFNLLVTASCLLGLSPTIHQIGFGLLVTASTARILYLLHVSPYLSLKSPARQGGIRLFEAGVASFLLGFAVWNVDNLACDRFLTPLKHRVGLPFSFLLEWHSVWHLLTGLAAYLAITGCSCLCLAIKEPEAGYHVDYGWLRLPYVARGRGAKSTGNGNEVEWEVRRMNGNGETGEGKKDI